MLLLRLAFRNIFRNRLRSIITLLAIIFGSVSLILVGGFIEDGYYKLRESLIHSQLGHIQIYKKGYYEKGSQKPFDYLIEDYNNIKEEILKIPQVKNVTFRLGFSGLLSTGDTTYSFIGQGVDPEGEQDLSRYVGLEKGEFLSNDAPYEAILGRGLASSFNAGVGDSLIILTNTKDGAINALDIAVRGIFYSFSKEYDDRALKLPLTAAQKLLNTDAVQAMVVILNDTGDTNLVKERLQNLFATKRLALEIKTWSDLADYYHKLVQLYNSQFAVLKVIISIIVIMSIFNAMNMSIVERTREIGTIMALGTKPNGVLGLFLLEGSLIGVIGGGIGVALGIVLAKVISWVGIPMPPAPGSMVGYTAAIAVVPRVVISAFLLSVLSAALSAFYPAFKASRSNIAEALRHV
ncbi:MAG: ABC transporter permease [Pseudomonadota bacterium]